MTSNMETLTCSHGHTFERERKRGPKPSTCLEHSSSPTPKPSPEEAAQRRQNGKQEKAVLRAQAQEDARQKQKQSLCDLLIVLEREEDQAYTVIESKGIVKATPKEFNRWMNINTRLMSTCASIRAHA